MDNGHRWPQAAQRTRQQVRKSVAKIINFTVVSCLFQCSYCISLAGCTPFSSLASSMSGGIAMYSPAPTSNIQIGSTASLICNTGFSPSGVTSATCTQFGWQPTSLGFCSQTGTPSRSLLSLICQFYAWPIFIQTDCSFKQKRFAGSIGGTGISCSAQTTPAFGSVTYSTGGSFGPFSTVSHEYEYRRSFREPPPSCPALLATPSLDHLPQLVLTESGHRRLERVSLELVETRDLNVLRVSQLLQVQ